MATAIYQKLLGLQLLARGHFLKLHTLQSGNRSIEIRWFLHINWLICILILRMLSQYSRLLWRQRFAISYILIHDHTIYFIWTHGGVIVVRAMVVSSTRTN